MDTAGEAFDAVLDDDRQEQLVTLTRREDCVLEKSAEAVLQARATCLSSDGGPSATGRCLARATARSAATDWPW